MLTETEVPQERTGYQYTPRRLEHILKKLHISTEEMAMKEEAVTAYLIQNGGRIVPRQELLKNVWGTTYFGERTIDVHIAKLRAKFNGSSKYFQTIKGAGYMYTGPYVEDNKSLEMAVEKGFTIYQSRQEAKIDNNNVQFPRIEFEFLMYMVNNHDKLLTYEDILKNVWKETYVTIGSVRVSMKKIREKLGTHSVMIKTVKNKGYRFDLGQ